MKLLQYKLTILIMSSLTLSFAPLASTQTSEDPTTQSLKINGLWLVESGNGKVEIKDCGDGTPCGTLVWINKANGKSDVDINNVDPDFQGRPLLGSAVFWGFKKKGEGWKSGKIYDAESGKTYKSKIKLNDEGELKVKGCVGPICKSQIWVRTTL
ncbi:MAG: DUF2147 domain-containing protein [Maricaulaceae bacterium]